MKRFFNCVILLGIMGFSSLYAQETVALDNAIKNSAEYFVGRIPKGAKVVILNFQSEYSALTDYVIDELTVNLVNDGRLTVVDRQNLEVIRQEMEFQLSGEVSDESAQAIGKKLGAQTIISGAITQVGDVYRLRVRAIVVETAAIQGMLTTNVMLDSTLAALTNTAYKGPPVSASKKDNKAPSVPATKNDSAGKFSLDGKKVFAVSVDGSPFFLLGLDWDWDAGGTITLFEKYNRNAFVTPSIFVTAKYFYDNIDDHGYAGFFAGGAGILFKRRLTRNERFLLNLGISLEYLGGVASIDRIVEDINITIEDSFINEDYHAGFGLFGMGIQGGLSFRLTPYISLDLNGIFKFGLGSVTLRPDYFTEEEYRNESASYTPVTGCAELGITFMLPY